MITTCSKCGRSYEEISSEEADRPDRQCMACFYRDRDYRIDNVYPAEVNAQRSAFLMYTGDSDQRIGLTFGLARCIGAVEPNWRGGWSVSINTPYDPNTDSDSRDIGTYPDRQIALGVLWANRHNADKSQGDPTMKTTIHMTSPAGVPITLEIGATAETGLIMQLLDRADQIGQHYMSHGWTLGHGHAEPGQGPAAAELAQGPTFAGYPCSPTVDANGIPTWIIVDGVQAMRREKQGDVWFSAKGADGSYTQVLRIPKGETAPAVKGL